LRRTLLLVVLACLAAAPLARADGDPASDWLLVQSVFVPPDAGVSAADAKKLTSLLADAKAKGYTLHVALINSRYDMGAVTILYKKPHQYAPFLSTELRFVYKGRVLVVMPNGYAIARDGKADPSEQKVLDRLPLPPRQGGLAAAAERAVQALAANAGIHVTASITPAHGGSSSNQDRLFIIAGGAALIAVAIGLSFWRRRAAPARRRSR
jgi:hypothetical protein